MKKYREIVVLMVTFLLLPGCMPQANDSQASNTHDQNESTGAEIQPSTIPSGAVGIFYHVQLQLVGATTSATAVSLNGELPNGLSLGTEAGSSNFGVISGTPTKAGTFNFSVTMATVGTNTPGANATQSYSLVISAASSSMGIVINSSSTISFSPNVLEGFYDTLNLADLSPQGVGYVLVISQNDVNTLTINTNFIPEINVPYTIANQTPNGSIEWSSGDQVILIESSGVEFPIANGVNSDSLSEATLTFTHAANAVGGNVGGTFSTTYDNGQSLNFTFNTVLLADPSLVN